MPDPRLYDQLKNPDAARRAAAVKELARSKDPEAIPYLERTADYDDDSNVRDLAEKAIIYIKRNSGGNEAPVAPSSPIMPEKPASPIGDAVVGAAPVINQPPKIVTARDEERSKRLLTDAVGFNMKGNDLKAVQAVTEAFKINPNLKNDKYAYGVVSSVTGMYGEEAIRAVMDGSLLAATVAASKGAGKAKRGGGGNREGESGKTNRGIDEEKPKLGESNLVVDRIANTQGDKRDGAKNVSLGGALIDLLLYGLVNCVILGVVLLLGINFLITSVPPDRLLESVDPRVASNINMTEFLNTVTFVGVGILIPYIILVGIIQMIGLLIQTATSHWVATSFFNGDGRFSELLHRFSGFYIIVYPLLSLISFVGLFLPVYIILTSEEVNTALGLGAILGILALIVSIYMLWGTATRIARTYDFGTGNGCLTLIIVIIILAILNIALTIGFSFLLPNMVSLPAMFAVP